MTKYFVLPLLFVFNSFAGINVVGKGGGFAEMLLLKIDRRLTESVQDCLRQSRFCEITPEISQALHSLLPQLPELQNISLEFTPKCSDDIAYSALAITIPSCLLYTKENDTTVVKSIQSLSAIVLKTRLQQAGIPLWDDTLLDPIFSKFNLIDTSYVLTNGTKQVVAHFVEMGSSWYSQDISLSLESSLETLDLTAQLKPALCADAKIEKLKIQFDRKRFLDAERFIFEGGVRWECNWPQDKFEARLVVSAILTPQEKFVPGSFSVQIRQKEKVW